MKTNETEDGVTHRHCHGGDGGWVLGVVVGVVSVGRSTVRRDFSSFDFAFRRSRDPSLRQCRRQKLCNFLLTLEFLRFIFAYLSCEREG